MQLTPREIEKLMVYTLADVALKRKNKGLKLNHPEAVAIITTTAMEGAREGKTLEVVMNEARTVLTKEDVMAGGRFNSSRPGRSHFHRWQSSGHGS